ncbi:hypothetical protein GCM10027423_14860 [Spirosoma arcticum]
MQVYLYSKSALSIMHNYRKSIPVLLKILLYVILVGLYIINPLGKDLPNKGLLIFPYAVIGLISFWNIKLFYGLWSVASVALVVYYFVA